MTGVQRRNKEIRIVIGENRCGNMWEVARMGYDEGVYWQERQRFQRH